MVVATTPPTDIVDDAAEVAALAAAVAEAHLGVHGVSHAEMRTWLLKIAAGDFTAQPPAACQL
jgi:hypothetical protein